MASFQQVIVMGHLGQDPEIKYMPSGKAVCNISVATTEKWKDKDTGQNKEDTEWHRIMRRVGIILFYIKKVAVLLNHF